MSTAQDVIDRARDLINDVASAFVSGVRWTDDELLRWLTDGQTEIVELEPEANAITDIFVVTGGFPRQRLDAATAIKLIRVEMNGEGGAAPVAPGPALTDHAIIAYGGNGSGSQQPQAFVTFGSDGTLTFYGGSDSDGSFFVDDVEAVDTGPHLNTLQIIIADQWWQGADLVPGAWQVRLTSLSGTSPGYGDNAADNWYILDNTRNYGQIEFLLGSPITASWLLEISDVATSTVQASATFTITNQHFPG